jgi:hypothetical protein
MYFTPRESVRHSSKPPIKLACHTGVTAMRDSARYVKIAESCDENQCYVGSAPRLVYGGCHKFDERAVLAELCDIVEDAIALRSGVAK